MSKNLFVVDAPWEMGAAHLDAARLPLSRAKRKSERIMFARAMSPVAVARGAVVATRARGARRRASTIFRRADGDGLREALDQANQAPDGTTQRDFANFYKVLNAQSPEDAQRIVDELAASGELTEGVVEAALATMQTAQQKGEKPEIVAALKGVFEYLLESFQRANAPPELEVIDAIVAGLNALDETSDASAEERVVIERVDAAGMTVDNFSATVDGFLIAMEEQDKQFEEQVAAMRAQGVDEEREQQLDQLTYMRANAKAQMLCIRDICSRVTGGD